MTVSAGRLTWDLDIGKQAEVLAKVDALGKKLDEALNKPRGGSTGLKGLGEDADRATHRVTAFQRTFARLNVELNTGQITATQYGASMRTLQGQLNNTARATNLSAREYKALQTLIPQVARAQATLGGTTAEVRARTNQLIQEIFRLRTNWQNTGRATEETKQRLAALATETLRYAEALRQADGGMARFGQQIRQLAAGGRTAEATIAGMEGRVSRLGLASQVTLGTQHLLTQQMYRLGPAGQIAGNALGLVGGGMAALSVSTMGIAGSVVAAGLAMSSLTKTGIPEIRELQHALRVMIADGNDLTESGLVRTLEDIRDAAGAAGQMFTRAQMATAMSELVKAGIDATEAMNLLAPGMQLATITGDSLNDTTSRLLANLRQFGLDTTHAARAADALARADLLAANSAKELSEGLAIVGPIGAAAGFAFEDLLGILVELDNKGMNPADIGATALRGTLSALLDPTAKAIETLDGLGVSLRDANGRARPLLDVLNDLQRALAENSEGAQAAAEIFNTRAITAILNMTDKSSELAEALRNSAGAAGEYAENLTKANLAMSEVARSNAFKDLAATFATVMAPGMTAANVAMRDLYRALNDLATAPWWEKLNAQSFIIRRLLFPGQGDPAEDPVEVATGWSTGGTMSDLGPRETPPDTQASMSALIAEAVRLKLALDAARDPEAWIHANRAVDTFKGSSEEAAEAWSAVNAMMRGETKSASGAKTPAQILKDLNAELDKLSERATLFGDTTQARIQALSASVSAYDRAIDGLVEAGVDRGSEMMQGLVQAQAEALAQLTRLQDPAIDARRWVTRLRTELREGLKSAETVFDLLNPRFQQLEERARSALAEFGFDSEQYQTLRTQLELIAGLLGEVEEEALAARRAPLLRAQAFDAAMKAEQAEIEAIQAQLSENAIRQANRVTRVSQEIARAMSSGNRALIEGALSSIDLFRTDFGDAAARQFELLEATLEHQLDRLGSALERLMENPIRIQQMVDAEVLGPGAGMATGQSYESPSVRRERMSALLREVTSDLQAGIRRAEEFGEAFGDSFDVTAEKARLTEAAIKALIEGGFTVGSSAVQAFVAELGGLNSELAEAVAIAEAFERAAKVDAGIEEVLQAERDADARARAIMFQVARVQGIVEDAMRSRNRQLLETAIATIEQFRESFGPAVAKQFEGVEQTLQVQLTWLEGRLVALASSPLRTQQMIDAEVLGPGAGMSTGMTAAEQRAALQAVVDRGNTIDGLQRQIINLRKQGVEPTDEAIQRLVRRINELQLAAAMKELAQRGIAGLSAFNRQVLEANGILPKASVATKSFAASLRELGGNDVASGLADVIDGIRQIREAGGDAEKVVAGLTLALTGATKAVESLGSGDKFQTIKNLAMLVGEGAGMAAGIPGVGQAVGAVFDLGKAIYEALSDSFTGDSPAARAIRESLTPAVASAFSNGIMQALRGQEGWQDSLRDDVKTAFVGALIQAFVQSAIVGAILEPLVTQYSKLIARGQYDQARAFLTSELPAALEDAMRSVDIFVGSMPPGFLAPTGGGGAPPEVQKPGIHSLPGAGSYAAIAAPAWALDLVSAGAHFRDGAITFSEAVDALVSQGILVRSGGNRGGGGAAAAARAA